MLSPHTSRLLPQHFLSSTPSLAKKAVAVVVSLCFLGIGCGDDDESDRVPTKVHGKDASIDQKLQSALDESPKAEHQHPAYFIPAQMRWVFSSDDAAAWKSFTEKKEVVKAIMASPLGDDLKMHDATLALEGLRVQVAQVAQLFGEEDESALWEGPTALGIMDLQTSSPDFLLVKTLSDGQAGVMRFAGGLLSFVSVSDDASGNAKVLASEKEREGVLLRQVNTRGNTFTYTFFKNSLIIGSSEIYVERAARLGLGKPLSHKELSWLSVEKGEDQSAVKTFRVPDKGQPGLSVSRRFGKMSLPALLGFTDVGWTLTQDEKAPLRLRTSTKGALASGFSLLRYAPASSYLAVALSVPLDAGLVENVAKRVLPNTINKSKKEKSPPSRSGLKLGRFQLERQLLTHLQGPVAVVLGAIAPNSDGNLQSLVLFGHQKRAEVEKGAKAAFQSFLGEAPSITRLASLQNAVLLTGAKGAGLAAAVTDDVLVLGLDEESVRAALNAGAGQTLSFKDRKGVDLDKKGTAFLYLDTKKAEPFLLSFYKASLGDSLTSSWDEAEPILAPVFGAIAKAGAGVALLKESAAGRSEGDFVLLP